LQTEESAKREQEIERDADESERERFKSRVDMQIEMQKR
jgi:hypothetical protein